MEELDRRYKKKLERNGSTTPSKPRVCGSPAASIPPTNAPQWAVNPDWTSPSPSSGMLPYPLEIIVLIIKHDTHRRKFWLK